MGTHNAAFELANDITIGTATTESLTTIVDGLPKILTTDNTAGYTPTENYHPATKKYVDDSAGGSAEVYVYIAEDYGAVGYTTDPGAGRTYSTTAIQDMVDAIEATGFAGVIQFKNEIYFTDAAINISHVPGIEFRGPGGHKFLANDLDTGRMATIWQKTEAEHVFRVHNENGLLRGGVRFRNLTIQGDSLAGDYSTGDGAGIFMDDETYWTLGLDIENCMIMHKMYGIRTNFGATNSEGTGFLHANKTHITSCFWGVYLEGNNGSNTTCYFNGCNIRHNGYYTTTAEADYTTTARGGGIWLSTGQSMTVKDCILESNSTGLRARICRGVDFSSNYFENNLTCAMNMDNVHGGQIRSNYGYVSGVNDQADVFDLANTSHLDISGNGVSSYAGTNTYVSNVNINGPASAVAIKTLLDTQGTGPPTSILSSSASTVGDRVYNSAPSGNGPMGWVCVTAGKPGAWREFGGTVSTLNNENALKLLLKLDQTAPTTDADDDSNYNHTCTLTGGITFASNTTAGKYSNALDFDETEGEYITIPASPGDELDLLDDFTIAFVIKPTSLPVAGQCVIKRGLDGVAGWQQQYAIYINSAGNVVAWMGNGTDAHDFEVSDTVLSIGTTYSVAFTCTSGVMQFYVDGVKDDSSKTRAEADWAGTETTGLVGALRTTSASMPLDSFVDDIRIYSRPLSITDIATLATDPYTNDITTTDQGPVQANTVIVYRDGTDIVASDVNGVIARGTTTQLDVVLESVMANGLTSGRTWQETIKIVGNYELSNRITMADDYVRLELDGQIKIADGTDNAEAQLILGSSGTDNCTISGGIWDSNGSNQTGDLIEGTYNQHGIYLTQCDNWLLENLTILDAGRDSLVVSGTSTNVRIVNCTATDAADISFYIGSTTSDVHIIGGHTSGSTNFDIHAAGEKMLLDGIDIKGIVTITTDADEITISNCYIDVTGFSSHALIVVGTGSSGRCNIIGNRISGMGAGYRGINVTARRDMLIRDNVITHNAGSYGILVDDTDNALIVGNLVSGAFTVAGIRLWDDCNDCTVRDNICRGADTAILIDAACDDTRLSNNILSSISADLTDNGTATVTATYA